MPNAYDPRNRQLKITHSPTARTPLEFAKLPKLDLLTILDSIHDQLVKKIKDLIGLDLSSFQAFIASLIDLVTRKEDRPIADFIRAMLTHMGDAAGTGPLEVFFTKITDRFGILGRLLGGLDFDNEPGAGTFWDNIIETLIKPRQKLAELFNGRLKDGQEPHALLDTWKTLWDNVFGSDDDGGPIERTLDNFREAVQALLHRQDDIAGQAETAVKLINFGASQPIWMHTNPTMQSPFGFLHHRKYAASGSVVTTHADPESIPCTQTASTGVFDVFDKSRDVDVVTFRCKASGTISACKAHLWRMDTATGDITFIRSETIIPAALPTVAFTNFYVPLGAPIHTDRGTVIGREITITGSGTLAVAGVTVPWLDDDLTARPRRPGFSRAVNAAAVPPATIADASIGYTTAMPAIGLGQALSALPTPKYTFTDGFDNITQWTGLAGAFTFSGYAYTRSTTANCMLFLPATYGDDSSLEFDLRTKWSALNPSFGNGDKIRLMMHCSANASQYVGLEIESNMSPLNPFGRNSIRIVTGTSPTGTPTVRTSDASLDNNYGGRLGIRYNTALNAYGAFIGASATPALTWFDSGHVISHGPGFRQAALFARFGQSNQPICDNFTYRDL